MTNCLAFISTFDGCWGFCLAFLATFNLSWRFRRTFFVILGLNEGLVLRFFLHSNANGDIDARFFHQSEQTRARNGVSYISQQEMLEIASLKADRIGADPDTCDF